MWFSWHDYTGITQRFSLFLDLHVHWDHDAPATLSAIVRKLGLEMERVKEARVSFRLSDILRTAETLSASKVISRDVRAQIQSHRLSGV